VCRNSFIFSEVYTTCDRRSRSEFLFCNATCDRKTVTVHKIFSSYFTQWFAIQLIITRFRFTDFTAGYHIYISLFLVSAFDKTKQNTKILDYLFFGTILAKIALLSLRAKTRN